MAEGAEGTGRTLEEARQRAAEALGLSVDDCQFEILEQQARGLFSKANFRVRAVPKAEQASPEPAAEVATPPEQPTSEPEPQSSGVTSEPETAPVIATQEDAERARELVATMLSLAGFQADVLVESLTGKYVNLRVSGPDEGVITERKGAVLDSLQFLGNALFSQKYGDGVRLTVDAGSYRSTRTQKLEKLALQVAAQVVKLKQEAVLDPLPAHERRVIHNALKDFEGVETYSEGEEPFRRVVISPKA
jgi:spoIIIJ-associated protein